MKKLWIFGDSFSEPFSKIDGMNWKVRYNAWKGYIPKFYGEIVASELNIIEKNVANGGSDNYTILDSIITHIDKIEPEDVIIIGWTNTLRFRVVNTAGCFDTIRPTSLEILFDSNRKPPVVDMSETTLKEITINRNNNAYIEEINNYIRLLNFVFSKNKIIHWSPFEQDLIGMNTTIKNLHHLERIVDETNNNISDRHFSEESHKIISKKIIDSIHNYQSLNFQNNLI